MLVTAAAITFVTAAVVTPEPRRVTVPTSTGDVVTRPEFAWNGKTILFETCLVLFTVCVVWLLVRCFRSLYERWKHKKRAA